MELDQNATGSANFIDGHKKRSSSRPTNYPGTDAATVDHVTTGNGQYFVLDAEAVNREAMLLSQKRTVFQ